MRSKTPGLLDGSALPSLKFTQTYEAGKFSESLLGGGKKCPVWALEIHVELTNTYQRDGLVLEWDRIG